MLKYYAGSLIVIFIILSILYKSNYKEKIKKDDVELKDIGVETFEDFNNWGQFIYIDE